MKFPVIQATNLLRQKLDLPADFEGDFNVLIVPFYQWQQSNVDSWVPFLRELEKKISRIRFYELPTIKQMNFLSKTFINEGMRAGIPSTFSRERTITLYIDKDAFRLSLEIPREDEIVILLSDRAGNIYWKDYGIYTPEKAKSLSIIIQQVLVEMI